MVRPPCIDSKGMKKGAWSKEEDDKLRAYILRYGHWNWRLLPKFAGLARCGKSCRLRWVNYLKPGLKRGNFAKHEQDLVVQLHAQLGNKWSAIAARLPGRTDNEVKNFWHTRVDKHKRKSSTPKEMAPDEEEEEDDDDDDDDNYNDNDNDDDGVFSFKEAQEVLMKEVAETTTTTTAADTTPTAITPATNPQQCSSSSSSAVNNSDRERLDEIETWLAADMFEPEKTSCTYDVDCFAPLMEEVGYSCDDIMNGLNGEFGCSEVSISSDSTYLSALDHWSIVDQEDHHHTISSDLWAAVDSNFSTTCSEEGFYDQIFNHGFNC